MANTYTQIYIQAVFAVQGRQSLISKAHKEELQKYITGIVQNHKHKLLAISFENQEQHHARNSFREEYGAFLEKFKIAYDPKYVFEFVDDDSAKNTNP